MREAQYRIKDGEEMYVYIQSEHTQYGSLWTVGFYKPDGTFVPESDHITQELAAARVHYLNGGK